jgi:hypothetical protein
MFEITGVGGSMPPPGTNEINDLPPAQISRIFRDARELRRCDPRPRLINNECGGADFSAKAQARLIMRIRFCISISLLVLLASYGCGGSSEIDMKQAQQAMDRAKSLRADSLAPADFQRARQAWDHAQAAEKEGKTDTAKVLFSSANIYFGKAADIAKAKQDSLSRELDAMQRMITSNFDQVKSDLSRNNLPPRQQGQVRAIVSEVEESNASIRNLMNQKDLLKAVATAKEVQTKIYNAQLILAGQKPSK